MVNPTKLLKFKSEKEQFVNRHADFVRFLERNFGGEILEGDEISFTYAHRDGVEESATVKLSAEDVQVIQAIAKMF